MSNLDPQTYDDNAINYDVKNSNIINSVSAAIGVSPAAVAASISREITRADDEMAAGATGEHAVSVDMAKNEFHPFTPGPKGGQVGLWVLFGNKLFKPECDIGERRVARAFGCPSAAAKTGAKGVIKVHETCRSWSSSCPGTECFRRTSG